MLLKIKLNTPNGQIVHYISYPLQPKRSVQNDEQQQSDQDEQSNKQSLEQK